MTDLNDTTYDINFFKPAPGMTRDNNRIITVFIIIWFIAVFGFQFLLIGSNKMTPEDTLVTFKEVWPAVEEGTATIAEQQAFGKAILMVLGKNIALEEGDKDILKESLNLCAQDLISGEALDPGKVAGALGLGEEKFDRLMAELLPFSLAESKATAYSAELPAIMQRYCMHPRGPLTEFQFLGFPFHYWYTAQCLLIIFVLLCLLYAYRIEKIYIKHNFVEEHN